MLTDPAIRVPVWDLERRNYAKREVSSIDAPSKPKVDVQESIANAKAYCKQNPESFVSLRDYSGGIYNETCAAFAAEQHAADPTYKIGSDRPAQDRLRKPGGDWAHGALLRTGGFLKNGNPATSFAVSRL